MNTGFLYICKKINSLLLFRKCFLVDLNFIILELMHPLSLPRNLKGIFSLCNPLPVTHKIVAEVFENYPIKFRLLKLNYK